MPKLAFITKIGFNFIAMLIFNNYSTSFGLLFGVKS